jgi:hypothetical protein
MTQPNLLALSGLPLLFAATIARGPSSTGTPGVDAGAGAGSVLPDGGVDEIAAWREASRLARGPHAPSVERERPGPPFSERTGEPLRAMDPKL